MKTFGRIVSRTAAIALLPGFLWSCSGGAGGTSGTGGATGSGGSTTNSSGGSGGSGGLAQGSGGNAVTSTGGASSAGGASGTGGASNSGGSVGTGGLGNTGGSAGRAATGGAAGGGSTGGNASGGARSGGAGGATATGGQGGVPGTGGSAGATGLPTSAGVLEVLRRANNYFVGKWPDPTKAIDTSHTSNIWTRAVYYEGLMALYGVDPQATYLDYAIKWGTGHTWGLNGGTTTRSADNQCAGQTYIDLYNLDKQAMRIKDIQTNIDMVVAGAAVNDWTWIDAIQMAMPVFAKLGVLTGSTTYFEKMYAMYANTKTKQGTAGLYSKTDHLWWRDQDFDPPYVEPNGKSCYWSRGNGWVYAALVRVLDTIPSTEAHRAEYLADFIAMSEAIRAVQRTDGFWNVSLLDPTNYGGKELTGTSLFTYGMAWGVRKGILSSATYLPIVVKSWNAMVTDSVHTNGFLGYVQGTGKQPSDSQPVTYDSVPNFEDFGVGCFLLGGSEVARLATP